MQLSKDIRTRMLQLAEAISAKLGPPYSISHLSRDVDRRTLDYIEGIARRVGVLPPLPGDGFSVPTVTTSIGTNSRDYSTIAGWESDLDNGAVYVSGDTAQGECYNDSAFDESFTINGGATVGLSGAILTVAAGQKHDGTAGSGARLVASTTRNIATTGGSGITHTIEWLEFDGASNFIGITNGGTTSSLLYLRNLLVHTISTTTLGLPGIGMDTTRSTIVSNVISYNLTRTAGTAATGVNVTGGTGNKHIVNVTVYNVNRNATGSIWGIRVTDDAVANVKNCIAVTLSGTAATKECFSPASPSNAVMSHNLSSDATASGTGSLINKSASNQFVSIVGGSEDLHLKTGADAIDAGTDLGTTPDGVQYDIDGRDRDAEGDTWDIGADEFVAAGSAVSVAALAARSNVILQPALGT